MIDAGSIFSLGGLAALGQVVLIDLVLAGDNAIVVGALAAGLSPSERKKVILIGILAALVLRIMFALLVTQLMQIVGLILAGGLLLLWVAWKMYRELKHKPHVVSADGEAGQGEDLPRPAKTFMGAAWAVALADVSMSLDNVLAVAGAAREHPGILVFGLVLAVGLMGVAANIIAHYIERFRWIAWFGLAVILFVACKMIYEGLVHHELGVLQYI